MPRPFLALLLGLALLPPPVSAGPLQSSLGLFLTGRVYHGKHGLSLRLRGLDPRLNSRAEARTIVIHGADYVSERTIAALGRLGRSQGCPALDRAVAGRVIELIRDGTVLYAYHPSARESTLAAR
jgi:L,D-transpeptidase catalytic domain